MAELSPGADPFAVRSLNARRAAPMRARALAQPDPVSGAMWAVGVGGVVLLGGLVAAIVLSPPGEAPGARRAYQRSRSRQR